MFLRLVSILALSATISLSVIASESIEQAKIELEAARQQEAFAKAEFDQAKQKHDDAGETVLRVYKNQFSKDPFTHLMQHYEKDWHERKNASYTSEMSSLDGVIKGRQNFIEILNNRSENPEGIWASQLVPEVEGLSKQEMSALDRLEESQQRTLDAKWHLSNLEAQAVSKKAEDALIAKLETESKQYAAPKPSLEKEKTKDELSAEDDPRRLEEMHRPKLAKQNDFSKKQIIIGSILAVSAIAAITTGTRFIYKRFFSTTKSTLEDHT